MGKWEMVRLGDVCTLKSGNSLPDNILCTEGIPYVKVAELNLDKNTPYVTTSIRFVANDFDKKQIIPVGSVIFPKRGGAIGTNKKRLTACPIVADLNIMAVIPNMHLLPPYLYFYFQQIDLGSLGNGSSVPQINNGDISPLLIPVPPLNEQKRIAKNLDLASEIVKGYKEQLAELDKLVQSVFYEMFGDPVFNPFFFPISALDKLADVVSGITKGRKLNTSQQLFEVPYMAVSNVKAGYIDWTKVKTIGATKEEIERYRILENDILMTEGGDPDKLGRGSIINIVPPNCIHQNHIFRVRCNVRSILPKYFSEYLKYASAKQYFLKCAKQTTGIASINMTQLRLLPVIVPPLPLQARFASIVTEIEAQKSQVQQVLTQAENLFNSLMQEYFE